MGKARLLSGTIFLMTRHILSDMLFLWANLRDSFTIVSREVRVSHSTRKALLLVGAFLLALMVASSTPNVEVAFSATVTITNPDGTNDTIPDADDFVTTVLGDPWDQNERYDIKWAEGISGIVVSDGIWSGTSTGGGYFFPFWGGFPTALNPKNTGAHYAIDTSRYTQLSFRIYTGYRSCYAIYWSPEANWPDGTYQFAAADGGSPGWRLYNFDLTDPNLGDPGNKIDNDWTGLSSVRALRIDPSACAESDKVYEVKVDWVRLTDPSTYTTHNIEWSNSGASTIDLFFDTDASGYDGQLIVSGLDANSGSYPWQPGYLPPDDYYIYALIDGGSYSAYSSGPLTINAPPIASIAAPSMTSGEDYATVVAGDAWDMSNSQDIAYTLEVENPYFSGGQFHGTATYPVPPKPHSDAQFYLNVPAPIDSSKYKYLSLKMYVEGQQDVANGWIARAIWWTDGIEVDGSETKGFVLFEDWQTYNVDLSRPDILESDPYPSQKGWYNPGQGIYSQAHLRIDPLETSSPTNFHVDYLLLTADDRADTSFNIRWSVTDADVEDYVTTTLYYDIDTLWNGNENFIAQVTPGSEPPSPPSGQYKVYLPLVMKGYSDPPVQEQAYLYSWDTSSVPAGTYHIWAEVTDGYNTTRWVSETPVVISH